MISKLSSFLVSLGLGATLAEIISRVTAGIIVIILCLIGYQITRKLVLRFLAKAISSTKTKWDDALFHNKVFAFLAHFVPVIIIIYSIPIVLEGYENWQTFVTRITYAYAIIMGMMVINGFLNAFLEIYNQFPVSREIPIKGFLQVIKIVVFFFGFILIISLLAQKTPLYFLSGLGAMTAVTMLVFKDSILGFVAGIQLTANNMLRHGDWIEMAKYGADGDVDDITLTTVKVRNWDKTITTIPTYALISESFKNWRGMKEAGGRRIMRSIFIDMNTIRFCTPEMLERYSKIRYIKEYLEHKQIEIVKHNQEYGYDDECMVNGRRLTNIGTFRAYMAAYLRNHPMVSQELTFLVRQLQPAENGLPIQIYVFCNDTVWANYEAAQADIFDHFLAIIPHFDLRVFQNPSGRDLTEWSARIGSSHSSNSADAIATTGATSMEH